MIRVVGFLLANYQLHVPFRSEFKVRHMTDRQTNKEIQTTAIDALSPPYGGWRP